MVAQKGIGKGKMDAADIVNSALEPLRAGLASDGFDLRLSALTPDGRVQVALEARANACMDCLIPDDLMVEIIRSAIRKEDASLSEIELLKVGFDQVRDH